MYAARHASQRSGTSRWMMPSSLGPNVARISSSVRRRPVKASMVGRNAAKQIGIVSATVPSRSKMTPRRVSAVRRASRLDALLANFGEHGLVDLEERLHDAG